MFQFRRGVRVMLAIAIMAFAAVGIVAYGSLGFAWAQDEISFEFRETLDSYGNWVDHPRWGEVWIPAAVPQDWRPYRFGHWVYTDEWGWYWIADEEWGWITYHYGRWVLDRDYGLGWIWIPGNEWSPAWVSWRQGDEVIGWAPMPPDGLDVQDDPDVWLFVRAPEIIAPAIVVLPPRQAVLFMRQTVMINETTVVRGNNRVIVSNPGVPPSFVAAKLGRPVQRVSIQPRFVQSKLGGALNGAPAHVVKPRGNLIRPAIDPMASHTSPNEPPSTLPGNQPNLHQPSWQAVHRSSPPPDSGPAIRQSPMRAPLQGGRIHQGPPPQHAGPQQQSRPLHD